MDDVQRTYDLAVQELRQAEKAYFEAESRLIQARRKHVDACNSFRSHFYSHTHSEGAKHE